MSDGDATRPPEPFVVTWVGETGSTNADLVAAARSGAPHGSVLVADHQTQGRGRLGRTWVAPPGTGLLCSVLLRPPPGAAVHGGLWAVALAARVACEQVAGVSAELKWPNDLVIGERKLAGVLAEAVTDGGAVVAEVVGIGINVNWSAPPPEIAARAVALNELARREIDRGVLLEALLGRLADLLDAWSHRPHELLRLYRAALSTIGQPVRIQVAGGDVVGRAIDVTDEGALVVVDGSGDEVIVTAGDLGPPA